ncbi:hypothetical protein O181_101949 [Austropuccinia psidii MF-1]|uniref:Uncharacterized protein n=1 Tax=Austropuccinia psidii MF-1 TaxID=1389203 RepID=A0A9Q3PHT4_9BASI|nr:hypothetical protein [Austropuccinia psidii MF-1]
MSEPELEPSMSNSNRYKSHSEGSNRHIHEPVQALLHGVEGKALVNVSTNPQRSDALLAYPEGFSQRGGNSKILQWMESNIIQTFNQKDKGVLCQNEGGKQGRSPSSLYQQASSQPTSPRREEEEETELGETIFPKLQDPQNPKRFHGQCLQHSQNLDGIQGCRGKKNDTIPFSKEKSLSPEVVDTLTEIKLVFYL